MTPPKKKQGVVTEGVWPIKERPPRIADTIIEPGHDFAPIFAVGFFGGLSVGIVVTAFLLPLLAL